MVLRVGKATNPGKLAMAIKAERGKGPVSVRAIGAQASWQLLKALAICGVASTMHFDTVKIDDKDITGVRCDVFGNSTPEISVSTVSPSGTTHDGVNDPAITRVDVKPLKLEKPLEGKKPFNPVCKEEDSTEKPKE